jgi:Fe-S-cluster containining protein
METSDKFSYVCNRCGRCCRDQVITLSPYDLIRIARAAAIPTDVAVRRYTARRGSLLKFDENGTCAALDGVSCSVYGGRPLACRLYPLGLERDPRGFEKFVLLQPADGSLGVFGQADTIRKFLNAQGVESYLDVIQRYEELLSLMAARIAAMADFDVLESREFWRVATREALAEANFDPNGLIDALFDADRFGDSGRTIEATADSHLDALDMLIRSEGDPASLAAAAVMLSVSLGRSPSEPARLVDMLIRCRPEALSGEGFHDEEVVSAWAKELQARWAAACRRPGHG